MDTILKFTLKAGYFVVFLIIFFKTLWTNPQFKSIFVHIPLKQGSNR